MVDKGIEIEKATKFYRVSITKKAGHDHETVLTLHTENVSRGWFIANIVSRIRAVSL